MKGFDNRKGSDSKGPISVLFIGDSAGEVRLLKRLLLVDGDMDNLYVFRLEAADTLEKGIGWLLERSFSVLVLGSGIIDRRGMAGLEEIREKIPDIPIIGITAADDKEKCLEIIRMGAQECLVKRDINRKLLVNCIRYSIGRQRLRVQLRQETAKLDKSEAQLRKIIEKNADGMIILDKIGKTCFMNPTAVTLLERSDRQLIGELFGFPAVTDDYIEIETVLKGGQIKAVEMRVSDFDWEGQPAFLATIRDVTELKHIENALKEEKERLDVTLRSIGEGVVTTDERGNIVLFNRRMEEISGWMQTEASGQRVSSLLNIRNKEKKDPRENPVEEVLKTGKTKEAVKEKVLMDRGNNEHLIEYRCSPLPGEGSKISGTVLVIRDVTLKKRMEEELIKARKLESLGVLAAGLAHEYNNELAAVLGNISMSRAMMTHDKKVLRRLNRAERSTLRAKELTQRLLTFSRGGEPIKKAGSLLPLVEKTAAWVRKNAGIDCRCHFPGDLPVVEFDEIQVKRVLGNIAKNAVESMPHGGLVHIKGEMAVVGKTGSLSLEPGNYIKISIADQGMGIPGAYLQKIFDPYFKYGKDTEGMGLATAYSIIKKHGGTIQVESAEEVGSTFTLFLPAVVSAVPTREEKAEPVPHPSTVKDTKQKILLMDDNPIFRKVARRMLGLLGYRVVVAKDGQEALRLYRKAQRSKAPFAAVILDLLVHHGMGGKECMEKLLKLDPAVKALVCSGYSDDPVTADYQKYGFRQRLPKPFKIEDLSRALKRLLS